ncbi:MAG: metallophosphoesterase [Patescibacteria group bacterium]
MIRINVFTDQHSSKGFIMEEAKLLIEWLEYWLLHWLIRKFKRKMRRAIKNHNHVRAVFEEMAGECCDVGIGVGDYSQTGSSTEAREARALLKKTFGSTPLYLVLGNHDTGSLLWFTDKWAKNFSESRLLACERIYETKRFGAAEIGDNVLLVWLLSEPFIFDWHRHNYLPAKTISLLAGLRQAQLGFLAETFRKHPNHRILLAVHDPSVLLSRDLRQALKPIRGRLMLTLTGHIHARWLMNLICLWHPILWPQLLWQMWRFKAKLIPSIWGITLPGTLWMAGAGWSTLRINDDGSYKLLPRWVKKTKTGDEDPG